MQETAKSLEQIRIKLLDLTIRNMLFNYPNSQRKKSIIIVDEQPNQIFDNLINLEKKMPFLVLPTPQKNIVSKFGENFDIKLFNHAFKSARDRLRETVLTNMGWKIHRIWSIGWLNHGEKEISRLINSHRGTNK